MSDNLNVAGAIDEVLSGGATPVTSLPVAGEEALAQATQAQADGNAGARANMEARLAEQRKEMEELHRKQMEQLGIKLSAEAEKGRVLSMLDGFMRASAGTEEAQLKVRVGIHELKEQVFHGELGKEFTIPAAGGQEASKGKKDLAWFQGRAEAHLAKVTEDMLDAGGQGELGLPGLKPERLSDKAGDGHFSAQRLIAGMVREHGSDLQNLSSLQALKGSPEAEWCVAHEGNQVFGEMLGKVPGGVRIPVPVAAFGGMLRRAMVDEALSEQYSEAPNTHEPRFGREWLAEYLRPMNNLRFLMASIVSVDNNFSVPRVTGVPTAQWRTDTQALTSTGLTLAKVTSKPQRVGVLDDVSWMLQAAADQIGIQPLALMEMLMSVEQETERAYYMGDGTGGQPVGAWNVTGIDSFAKPGSDTYTAWLEQEEHFTTGNYDLGSVRAVMGWAAKRHFQAIYTAPNNGYQLFRSVMTPGGGDGALGVNVFPAGQGFWLDRPAVASTQMPENVQSSFALGGAGANSAILSAIWRDLLMIRFRMGVLTVDTMSKADAAQTRMSYNEFCDVLPRRVGSIQRSQI